MQHQTYTLFEYESQPFDWNDRHVALLERLRSTLSIEPLRFTIQRGQRIIQAAEYVGMISLGQQTIQILPKIYRTSDTEDERQRIREATRNLLHLLAYAGQFTIKEPDIASLMHRDANWFEILTRMFASHLAEEWQRGPTRTYQTVEDDLPLLKGKWLLTQQLRRPERRHRFTVVYDEFTVDNRLNRVLRFVTERLWHSTRDPENRRRIGELRHWMDDVTVVPFLLASDADLSLITRLNQRYRPLLNLARLFLQGNVFQLARGATEHFTLLFDMNGLFESFIAGFFRRHRDSVLPLALQQSDILVQMHGAARYLARVDGTPIFRLVPDLALREGDRFHLLVDTKYKHLDETDRALGASQADIYQMYAYAQRYDCPTVVLLYPQTSTMPIRQRFVLESSVCRNIIIATVDIRIDLGRSADRARLAHELCSILLEETKEW